MAQSFLCEELTMYSLKKMELWFSVCVCMCVGVYLCVCVPRSVCIWASEENFGNPFSPPFTWNAEMNSGDPACADQSPCCLIYS